MDRFWERYIQSRPAPGESKGAFEAFAAEHRDPGPRNMAQEPRNMYAGGQLVQNTADGSRPGYSGWTVRLLNFVKNFKKTFDKLPTQTEIHNGTGAAAQTIKKHLNEGTDFIVTSRKDVGIMGGLKAGAKKKKLAGSVSEVSSDLIEEVNNANRKGMSVAIDTATSGSKFLRLRITDDAIKGFGDNAYPATKENLKKIKTKIKKIEKSPEYRSINPFKTPEYYRKLVNLKYAHYKKQDPFGIYKKLQEYKTEKFPGTLSSDIQIQHGQPKFTTQTLSRWGLIPKHVQTLPAVEKTERIRNELLSQALVKLKNPNRSIADKKKIIGEFNDAMRGLRGHLKGTEGQGSVNFELLKLDEAGNVAKLKDVGFDPKKGLAYGDELGELDFAKITKDQADQIIALGKEKIDLELLRQVLPSKLKNIVNPLPPSRYYEAGGRVGFRDGSGDIKADEKGNAEKIKKILKKKGINLKSGEAGSIAKKLLNDFGKMGLKGTKLLRWLQLEYDILFEGLIYNYHRRYKGQEPELAREALWLPKIIANYAPDLWEKAGFEPFKAGVWEGPEKILEERLMGENESVKNYMDNKKKMEEISSKYRSLDFAKGLESDRRPGQSYYAEPFAHPRLDTIVNEQRRLENEYNQLDQLNKPDALTGYHSAYQAAKEKQDTKYGVKATEAHKKRLGVVDIPWDIENPNEMLNYDKSKEQRLKRAQERFESEQADKRQKAIEDKYPTLTKYEVDKKLEDVGLYIDPDLRSYKGRTVQRPEGLKYIGKPVLDPLKKRGMSYDDVRDYWKDLDKQSYFADNFRMEKAGGGMVGIRKPSAIAPTGGPMDQGLPSLYNNVRKR